MKFLKKFGLLLSGYKSLLALNRNTLKNDNKIVLNIQAVLLYIKKISNTSFIFSYKISSPSENELYHTPPDSMDTAKYASESLLPSKSRERYETTYQKFMDWRLENNTNSFSENVLLAYFQELSNQMKPTTLWSIYSMLRTTLNIYNNLNITAYAKLTDFLKSNSYGFKSRKSKILSSKQIDEFLKNAPDKEYLFMKVIFVVQFLVILNAEYGSPAGFKYAIFVRS